MGGAKRVLERGEALADGRRARLRDPGNDAVQRLRFGLGAWWGALLRGDAPLPAWLAVWAVACVLAMCWWAGYALGGAGKVAPHWFYVAILFAAVRFGIAGAWVTGALAGLLAGPLLPLDVDAGIPQTASDWLSRSVAFLGIGTVIAWLVARLQRALRRELLVLERERELAQRSAAVIQSVGHEFRTPLTVLSGTVEVLRSRRLESGQHAELVDGMGNAVRRLSDLVTVVIATSEAIDGTASSRTPIDVNALCRSVAVELESLGGGQRVRVPDEQALVSGDERLLGVALRAVIENALKFSRPDAPVDITTTRSDDAVRVAVRDRGPGIDRTVARRSLEAPFTPDRHTAAAGGGLGLGLFAAGKALERLGGTIEFQTPPGGGTAIVIRLPGAKGDASSALAPRPRRPAA